jgi:hypothetical protein
MFKPWPIVFVSIVAMFLAGGTGMSADTTQSEKSTGVVAPTPAAEKSERERKLAAATEAAQQLLLAMDTKKSGKISRQEWMTFMEEEFNRLDTNHSGELDVKELTQSRVRVRPFVGK